MQGKLIILLILLMSKGVIADTEHSLQVDISHPALVQHVDGTLTMFVRGQNNKLVQRGYEKSKWSGWRNHGGQMASAAGVVSRDPRNFEIFYLAPNKNVIHRSIVDGRMLPQRNLGGSGTSTPAVVMTPGGIIHMFIRGLNGKLVQRTRYANGNWSGWKNHGGELTSAPSAVIYPSGMIKVFYRGIKNNVYHRRLVGGNMQSVDVVQVNATSAPSVVLSSDGHLLLFYRADNGKVRIKTHNNASWVSTSTLTSTVVLGAPSAAAGNNNEVNLVMQSVKNTIVHQSGLGRNFGLPKDLGGHARGELRGRLELLTQNIYGLSEKKCSQRGKQLGRYIATRNPAYDIVGIQEFYDSSFTCDIGNFANAIKSTGRYMNDNNSKLFTPRVRWRANGGVGVYSLHSITKTRNYHWSNDQQGTLEAVEGFIFSRIKLNHSNITVDTYVVHLNSGGSNVSVRRKQLQQLARKIRENSRNSGNPVIVMGDFNIGGAPSYRGNDGHEDVANILKRPKDLWLEVRAGEDGYTFDCLANNTTSGCDYQNRVDYIYHVTDPYFTNSPYMVKIKTKNDVRLVRTKTRSGQDASDHYGVGARLEFRDK